MSINNSLYKPFRLTGAGEGVQVLPPLASLFPKPLHPPIFSIASPLLLLPALVGRPRPSPRRCRGLAPEVRSSKVLPAGVKVSAVLRGVAEGVIEGGPIIPSLLPRLDDDTPPVRSEESTSNPLGAVPYPLARSFIALAALVARFLPIRSRLLDSEILNAEGAMSGISSGLLPIARGVDRRVPHVMSSETA